MKQLWISFHFIVLTGTFSDALAAPDGNALFEAGQFEKAAEAFQHQISEEGSSAALLYNLGNAYFRLEDFGRAIHAYEQALTLDSSASDIRTNLELARGKLASFEEPRPLAPSAFWYFFTLNQWSMIALVSFVVIAAMIVLIAFSTHLRRTFQIRLLGVTVLFTFLVSLAALLLRKNETSRAIVLDRGTPVMLSPFATADVVATLPAGRDVQIGKTHEGYVHVGPGWVAREQIAPVYHVSKEKVRDEE